LREGGGPSPVASKGPANRRIFFSGPGTPPPHWMRVFYKETIGGGERKGGE